MKGTTFKINHILYVDDSMFIFETKNDMIKGAEILRKHMLHFGLLMHYGKDGKNPRLKQSTFLERNQGNRQGRRSVWC
jgi:hypothetical protein